MTNLENYAKTEAKKAQTRLIRLIAAHPKTVMSIVAGFALAAVLAALA